MLNGRFISKVRFNSDPNCTYDFDKFEIDIDAMQQIFKMISSNIKYVYVHRPDNTHYEIDCQQFTITTIKNEHVNCDDGTRVFTLSGYNNTAFENFDNDVNIIIDVIFQINFINDVVHFEMMDINGENIITFYYIMSDIIKWKLQYA